MGAATKQPTFCIFSYKSFEMDVLLYLNGI